MIKSIYHLHPEKNWMNDPNGPAFFGGQFHMFFQHNPFAPVWGNMTWGHAVSPDMVRWKLLPNALHPDMWYDKDGVFSGCCVVKDDTPHIIYTGTNPETQCLAIGDKDGKRFIKYESNPILVKNKEDKRNGWRDPYVIKEPDGNYTLLIGTGAGGNESGESGESENKDAGNGGAGIGNTGGAYVEQYAGDNLIHWTYKGRFCEIGRLPWRNAWNDTMWECPVVAQGNDGEAALFVSAIPGGVVHEITGRYEGGIFTPAYGRNADLGDSFYAPNIMRHPDGRWILYGWMCELGTQDARAEQGWQGMLTLPRELFFRDGRLYMRPAAETGALREKRLLNVKNVKSVGGATGQHYELVARYITGGGYVEFELLRDCEGNCVKLSIDAAGARLTRSMAIAGGAPEILCSADEIYICETDGRGSDGREPSGRGSDRCETGGRGLDGCRSCGNVSDGSGSDGCGLDEYGSDGQIPGGRGPGEERQIRIFVDGTAIEAYFDSCRTLTTRAYPHDGCTELRVNAVDGAVIDSLEVYQMGNCYI